MNANPPAIQPQSFAPPRLLTLAVLLFWGWQSGLWLPGLLMGLALETIPLLNPGLEFSQDDFRRVWNFCNLLGLAAVLYAFGNNDRVGGLGGLLHGAANNRAAMLSGVQSVLNFPRWLPILLFLAIAAQKASAAGLTPATSFSPFLRWYRQKSRAITPEPMLDLSYPYLILCLFSAGIHANSGSQTYFMGMILLVAWGLWPVRSCRFHPLVWLAVFGLAAVLALAGDVGVGKMADFTRNLSIQWMSRLLRDRTDPKQVMTAIGEVGQLKLSGAIEVRLTVPPGAAPPEYLHLASYRTYHRQSWFAGAARDDFQEIPPLSSGASTFQLIPGRSGSRLVTVSCYLAGWSSSLGVPEGLLPIPPDCDRLEDMPDTVASLQRSGNGAVLADGPGLMIFTAGYGTGQIPEAAPNTNEDLAVPAEEVPALNETLRKMSLDKTRAATLSPQKLESLIAGFFDSRFTYRTWQKAPSPLAGHQTPLANFLLITHSGHCEYFATATVMLLRMLGVPARYAVGFYVHERSGDNSYVVRGRDAHAWCLVWDRSAAGWQTFDTTPASWVGIEGAGGKITQAVEDFFSWLHYQAAKIRWGQSSLRSYVRWLPAPVLLALLAPMVFRRWRRVRQKVVNGPGNQQVFRPGLDSAFYPVRDRLVELGHVPRVEEGFAGWLARILEAKHPRLPERQLRQLFHLHYRCRFHPRGLTPGERDELASLAAEVLHLLNH